jgi:tetratricopeptide (TPR) repeat protein
MKPSGQLGQVISMFSTLPSMISAHALLGSGKPMQAIQTIEKLLRKDPLNISHVKLLTKAAEAADEPEIAIQTLALAQEQHPGDTYILETLGQLYMKTNQSRLGRECFETLVALKPNDSASLKLLKDSMAIDSMAKDGWSDAAATGGSFRKMIRDEKKAEILEREEKAVKGKDDIEALITENKLRIQREPNNINYRRALALLYTNNKMFEEAISTLKDAQTVAGGRDPSIDQAISATRVQSFDVEIDKLRQSNMTAAIESKIQERAQFLFNDLQERVTRYPNDLASKHDLGVLLFQQTRINEAIQQFQSSQRNAQHRISSIYHLGLCFQSKQQYDLATEQLQKAAADLPVMDEQKKAVVYELGRTLEMSGHLPEAMDCFKQIYQADIGYRDVADKVEHGYKSKA